MLRAPKMSEPGARISPCSPAKLQLQSDYKFSGRASVQFGRSIGESIKLPTDPQGRNDERALWAQVALAAFVAETGTDETTVLVEFLAGVMHWCDRSGRLEAHLERARSLYREEKDATEMRLAENVG